jgi:hypothetical protein
MGTPVEQRMVEVGLMDVTPDGDEVEVTDATHAREVVNELLGPDRAVEAFDFTVGSWLVEFTDDELAQLRENRYFGLDNDGRRLEAEWPL